MKKLIFLALATFPMILTAGQYAGIHAGTDYRNQTATSNVRSKGGMQSRGVYGYDFANGVRQRPKFRIEKAISEHNTADAGEDQLIFRRYDSHHSWSYMANLCYDISQLQMWSLTPYFGIGAGYVQSVEHRKTKYDVVSHTEKRRDHGFAYQAIAGLKYPIADQVNMTAQYCYHIPGPHTKNHSVTVGLVKAF